jgi:hypothetical protein
MTLTVFIALLCVLAGPFWSDKPPSEWTDEEIGQLLTNSPWAQSVQGAAQIPAVDIYLATAGPVRQAEEESRLRAQKNVTPGPEPAADPAADEYSQWMDENRATQIILAIRVNDPGAYENDKELDRFEKESVMRVGRKKVLMTGYFPPTAADPFLRIAFPRDVGLADRQVRFELYIPGILGPFRGIEFRLDRMMVNGKLEL